MKAKATLKQIAQEFGVSISTVSKALSDSPEISDATKIKIQEYAALQNYKPNSIAKNLKNQRTNIIGVIIPNILNPFFAKVFSGIEKVALEKGYNVITGISNESFNKEQQVMDMLNNGTIDGFIVAIAEETQSLKEYKHFKDIMNSGTPIVMFDRVADGINCDKVVVDGTMIAGLMGAKKVTPKEWQPAGAAAPAAQAASAPVQTASEAKAASGAQ